jgi:hypothetical protein
MPISHDVDPDPPMTPEQAAIAASLSDELALAIEHGLLSNVDPKHFRKVARVVGSTMMDERLRVPGLPDVYYAGVIKDLVRRGLLVADGNLDYMRYSEIRLP